MFKKLQSFCFLRRTLRLFSKFIVKNILFLVRRRNMIGYYSLELQGAKEYFYSFWECGKIWANWIQSYFFIHFIFDFRTWISVSYWKYQQLHFDHHISLYPFGMGIGSATINENGKENLPFSCSWSNSYEDWATTPYPSTFWIKLMKIHQNFWCSSIVERMKSDHFMKIKQKTSI